ncbi:hypothetical protein ZORO111903_07160 [Zobellia roscoffensis]|uniref:HD domain-containing protein n=1 Tax=Zobellia roscoffensis TaxID=2779508 RepID=UPI00188D0263|nr:hypothetical protein [Zobellia roscoffensis]
MNAAAPLLKKVQEYVSNLFTYHLSKKYCFHNLEHTKNIVLAVGIISDFLELDNNDKQVLQLAAWFHCTGYLSRPMDNEPIAVLIAENYLRTNKFSPNTIHKVRGCILATRKDSSPKNHLEAVIKDADMFHISQDNYWTQNWLLRDELNLTCELQFNDAQWYKTHLDFLKNFLFRTAYGEKFLEQSRNNLIYENETILKSISGNEKESLSPIPSHLSSMGTREVFVLESGCRIAI